MTVPGTFIVFEGGEGSGKSTMSRRLAATLAATGRPVMVTREPGGTRIGEHLRTLLLGTPMPARAEALLYLADRAVHVDEIIIPELKRGTTVICDRYIDSTCAYQGIGRGLDVWTLSEMSWWAAGGLRPNLVIILDVDPRDGLARVRSRPQGPDLVESADLDFHNRVRQHFLARAERAEQGWRYLAEDEGVPPTTLTKYVVVDAAQPVDVVAAEVSSAVTELFLQRERVA